MSNFDQYARPDVLVSTDWLAEHLDDDDIRIVESNEDVTLYATGHIPGAVNIDWTEDLQDQVRRDYVTGEAFAELAASRGISNDTTVIFYGADNNWWAAYALWVFRLNGHTNAKILDGGRKKWVDEGRELTTDVPDVDRAEYEAPTDVDLSIRAYRDEVQKASEAGLPLVDVRSPAEYTGEIAFPPDCVGEAAQRAGHIPGAKNIPWKRAVNDDGTFKSREDLEAVYEQEQGIANGSDVIAYCRIGERSSHTWFVLKFLLGHENVKNYDGSWSEWGNLVGVPVEQGAGQPQAA